jgi:hypothetical protein
VNAEPRKSRQVLVSQGLGGSECWQARSDSNQLEGEGIYFACRGGTAVRCIGREGTGATTLEGSGTFFFGFFASLLPR